MLFLIYLYLKNNMLFFNEELNNILGNGIPTDNFIEIVGEKGVGKTTLAYNIIKNAQQQGLNCCYFDIENSFDKKYAEKCGINTNKLLITLENDIEFINQSLYYLIDNMMNIIIFDSWAGINFIDIDVNKILINWKKLINNKNIILIFINQNRRRIQTYRNVSFDRSIMNRFMNIRIKLNKLNSIFFNHINIGQEIELTTIKNIYNKPFEKINLNIYYNEGISDSTYLIEKMIKEDKIQKINHFYYYKDKLIANGLEDLRNKLINKELILC